MKAAIDRKKCYYEDYSSQIVYSIDENDLNSQHKYSGAASASVQDKKGNTRTLNVTTSCNSLEVPNAKESFLIKLEKEMRFGDEKLISPINYNIETCN
ncbi:hypothetical protein [Rhizosphaericola mali]|uniref:Uncharacterized protein n=1 Tax=Rhizosphaericola mali TaxID=2545455 RepID=A0A5P2GD43_9BACT|nr:hypothetical protein [Rhizosphaericola mali]QES89511.1 hypothetical protein E0W69_012850 [Rhizosphaericola mali]